MKIDSDPEIATIPQPAAAFFYGCNFGVQFLRNGIGYAMFEIAQYIGQAPHNQFHGPNHGGQAAVCRTEIPTLPETFGPLCTVIASQFTQQPLQRPSAPCLRVALLDLIKSFTGSIMLGSLHLVHETAVAIKPYLMKLLTRE